jgi:hypothetical protein
MGQTAGTRRNIVPGHQCWGLGVGLSTHPGKFYSYEAMEEAKTHTQDRSASKENFLLYIKLFEASIVEIFKFLI